MTRKMEDVARELQGEVEESKFNCKATMSTKRAVIL